MSHESAPLFELQQLEKAFFKNKKEIPVLRGVDLRVYTGETLALTGASGAGKSTLLHIMGGLEPPTRGKVLYGKQKQDIYQWSESRLADFRNRSVGFVFQFHYLLPEFTALENVMMPGMIAGLQKGVAQRQARELMEFVGLAERLEHRPSEMSGGEQQRVAIARAVILRPEILFADELTGNLDSSNSDKVMQLLSDLNEATGISIVLVTHDHELARRMQRVFEMKDGRILG